MSIQDITVIGIDLGGTKVLAGKVRGGELVASSKKNVPKGGTEKAVIDAICLTIDEVLDESVVGIGIGVPSVVDIKKGIVYDVQNISSWKEVHLKDILENKYGIPVYLNNDANCFAIGEKYAGKGKQFKDFVGLIVGTGIAAGLIIHNKIYNGHNCGAGEFGMLPYLDHNYEYYSSGQFFSNIHQVDGESVFRKAQEGDASSLAMFKELGKHIGNTIKAILFSFDPAVIIMGGSVSKAYPLFRDSLWKSIHQMEFREIPDRLTIEISTNPNIPVLGAAALYSDAMDMEM